MTSSPAIETHSLAKSYGSAYAVRGLNLAVQRNCITAFLGRNGAGKSTTIKMLLGMIAPSSGGGTVLGKSIRDRDASREARTRIAYVAEDKPLYDYMTVEQTVRFTSSFYPDWRSDRAAELIERYNLPLKRKVHSLSKGMRTKLALLLAFARCPELAILDEPSEGLDPVGIEDLLQALVGLSAEGATVFFSSHQIAEVERIADRVCILDEGRLLLDASLDDLRRSYRCIDLAFSGSTMVSDWEMPGVESVHGKGGAIRVFASGNVKAVIERARELGADSIEESPVGLREIFLEAVRRN
jgi:ABC-2 type transport system ATP-binding protein